MSAKQSEGDVKAELENMLGPDRVAELGDRYLSDYAKIGSLMTDEEACRVYLARLSSRLVTQCEHQGMREKARLLGIGKNKLKTTQYAHESKPGETVEVVKHHKVFTDFFNEWEAAAGFNNGVQQIEGGLPSVPAIISLPARAPTLTEFVMAVDFRKYLLKHGFHWKDSGVGEGHGEFTHRIHWYIIIEYSRANPGWLLNEPIELFKKCGDPVTAATKSGKTVWDYIVDSGRTNFNEGTATKGQSNYYRCPEILHGFLCETSTRSSKDLWCLAYLIWGRREKRKFVGSVRTTQDLQEYIRTHNTEKEFRVVGFKTGEGIDTHGTIMWKDRG